MATGTGPDPDPTVLRLLIATAETGSLSRAADQVGLAQPNASRAMRTLERDLGFSVLHRGPRGSVLTTEGAVVVDWARSVVESLDALHVGTAALRRQRAGRTTVAASKTVAEYLVPSWLGRLHQDHPGAHVSLTVANSHDVSASVLGGDVDLGFIESTDLPRGLHRRRLGVDELVVVVAPEHRWARRRRPLTADELAATALLVREPGSGTRVSLEHCLRRQAGRTLTEPAQELSSNAAIKIAAAAGLAPAVLSRLAVADQLAAGRLVEVSVDELDLRRPLTALWTRPPRDTAADLLRLARVGLMPQ